MRQDGRSFSLGLKGPVDGEVEQPLGVLADRRATPALGPDSQTLRPENAMPQPQSIHYCYSGKDLKPDRSRHGRFQMACTALNDDDQ